MIDEVTAFETVSCDLCGNASGNRSHRAREMFFGYRDEFQYIECGACGCLRLLDVPGLGKYYPPEYYSYEKVKFRKAQPPQRGWHARKRQFINERIMSHYFNRDTALGQWLERRSSIAGDYETFLELLPSFRDGRLGVNVTFQSRVLDVGCGAGHLLYALYEVGFRDLLGAEPFIERDLHYDSGFRVLKRTLSELDGEFDLIFLRHVFEHMPEPLTVLRKLRRLLRKGQYLIVTIPVVNAAWLKYGVDWVGLDPPRHLYLYTPSGFMSLAEKAGFHVADTVFDSTEFQFWASEQYRANVPLLDPASYEKDPARSMFTPEHIAEFRAESHRLNRSGEGDCASFYLR